MGVYFHVYMPRTYIVEVIWECYQLQAKYASRWFDDNKLVLNPEKCKCIILPLSLRYFL